eukprot:gnl/TRDRNA2_/TRDRNA2_30267_c0_seq1.p1 gnl/TRDRNA2_/TRDRNA2_30267_c0~~gnl/TRDRNA2_/TRDRNA2_30267_c0_seq1.p1  ORF type:complete len:108 (-),score=24.99 gnl/TRDRNA2_/TRDRNA2_30267_c0_seq1:163-486(-)
MSIETDAAGSEKSQSNVQSIYLARNQKLRQIRAQNETFDSAPPPPVAKQSYSADADAEATVIPQAESSRARLDDAATARNDDSWLFPRYVFQSFACCASTGRRDGMK